MGLIVATTPDDKIFTNGNYDNYAEMLSTNALRRDNVESETKPKTNKSWKWKHILKPIWDAKDLYTVNGITPSLPTIILHYCARRKILYIDIWQVKWLDIQE